MSKFLITEEEKMMILEKYYPKENLNEGWKEKLLQFFGKSADDLARNYTDDALNNLNNVFTKALSNTANFVLQGGKKFIKSANPQTAPVAMEKIDSAVLEVINGRMPKEQLLNGVPRYLPDQTPFRDQLSKIIDDLLRNKKPAVKQASGADYRAQVSQSQNRYGGGSN